MEQARVEGFVPEWTLADRLRKERARRDSNPKPSDPEPGHLVLLTGGLSVNQELTHDRPILWAVPDWREVAS